MKAKRRKRKDESKKTKAKRRKDEGEKTKRRKRKDESEKTLNSWLHVFVISPSLCRLRYFVMSPSLFRLFAFALSPFRYGAFVMSPRNNEKTKWHKSATIVIFVYFALKYCLKHHSTSFNTIPKADIFHIIQSNWFCVHIITPAITGCVKIKGMNLANIQMEVTFARHI